MARPIEELIKRWGKKTLAIKAVLGPGDDYDQAFRYIYQQAVEHGYRPSFEALEKHIAGVMSSGVVFLIGRPDKDEVRPIGAVSVVLDSWGEWYSEPWPRTAAMIQDLYIEPQERGIQTIISVIDGLMGITKGMGADVVLWEEMKEHAFFDECFEKAHYYILRHDNGEKEVSAASAESG